MKRFLVASLLTASLLPQFASTQQGVWRRIESPHGGQMKDLIMNSRGDLFASSYRGNIFRSVDRGSNWHLVFAGGQGIHVIALDPRDYLYAGIEGRGLFQSTDNGDTWTCINRSLTGIVAIAFNDSNHIYVGTGGSGLYVSRDRLKSWSCLPTRDYEGFSAFFIGKRGLILTSNSYHRGGTANSRSTNGGRTWGEVTIDSWERTISTFAFSPSGELFAGAIGGLFRSTDLGKHWKEVKIGFRSDVIGCIAFAPSGAVFVGTDGVGHENGLYCSSDYGNHWTEIKSNLPKASVSSIVFGNNGEIFLASGDGIRISTDEGKTWRLSNHGITDLSLTCMSSDPDGNIYAGASYGRLFRTTNEGLVWSSLGIHAHDATSSTLEIDSSGTIYLCSASLFVSHDRGSNWISAGPSRLLSMSAVAINKSRAVAFFRTSRFGESRFMETVDQGYHWRSVQTTLDTLPVNGLFRGDDGHLYTFTAPAPTVREGGLFRSIDRAKTWQLIATFAKGINAAYVSSNAYYVSNGWTHNVRVSIDDGLSWSNYVIDSTDAYPGVACFQAIGMDTVYAGCSTGIFCSTNKGMTWTKCPSFPPAEVVFDIRRTTRGTLLARTESGIYLLGR